MLREPSPCVDIAIEHFRTPEVFYSHVHREIYQVIIDLYADPELKVDIISVAHRLKTLGKLDAVGGELFLAELDGAISTTVNIESWCLILRKYATLRKMIDVCSESLLKCYDQDADAGQLVEQIETDIYKVRNDQEKSSNVEVQDIIADEFRDS